MRTKLIKPIGYCYGVTNAINFSIDVKNKHEDKNVYIFGLLIHNKEIIPYLEKYNIHTIDTSKINMIERLNKFTCDDVVIFTAHGHKKEYEEILKKNNVIYYDAVCPIVQKNIDLILNTDKDIIYIGKSNHPESEVCRSLKSNVHFYDTSEGFDFSKKLNSPIVINQTTLSFLELHDIHQNILSHYNDALIHDEICNATRIRQENINSIPNECDLLIVVGDKKSSNSTRLFELALKLHPNKTVLFIENIHELKEYSLNEYNFAYITSGTSTPMNLINEINNFLLNLWLSDIIYVVKINI